jgi:hypothetical protein
MQQDAKIQYKGYKTFLKTRHSAGLDVNIICIGQYLGSF